MWKQARYLSPLLVAAGLALPVLAQDVIVIEKAPPQPRAEAAGTPRDGQVWAPGYWNWDGSRHVWVDGHYVAARPGYRYVAPQWSESNGRYTLSQESWTYDEDNKSKTEPSGVK
jgi:hypothetical protein